MAAAILITIFILHTINKLVSWLHSTDDFLAMEAQVHLKLATRSMKTCGYLNLGESPNCQNAIIFDFYWQLLHV